MGKTTYTLITVTHGGDIRHSRGYESLHMCEQAKCLAMHGLTLEQKAERDAEVERQRKEAADAWRAAHPARVPTAKEREMWRGTISCSGPYCTIGADGLLYEWPAAGWFSYGSGRPDPDKIKYAACLVEPTQTTLDATNNNC